MPTIVMALQHGSRFEWRGLKIAITPETKKPDESGLKYGYLNSVLNGGHDKVRTCDPCDVNTVLYR
jgi:hypothetical protein